MTIKVTRATGVYAGRMPTDKKGGELVEAHRTMVARGVP